MRIGFQFPRPGEHVGIELVPVRSQPGPRHGAGTYLCHSLVFENLDGFAQNAAVCSQLPAPFPFVGEADKLCVSFRLHELQRQGASHAAMQTFSRFKLRERSSRFLHLSLIYA